jgi:peroxiredoxin-like protein
MQQLPHHYEVSASALPDGDVPLWSHGLPGLATASPREFDGPGDRWSPETLLAGAVADCFILTFRAVARASKLTWHSLDCNATATLDRVDGVTRFTQVHLHANLMVPSGVDETLARRLLQKAEDRCLISRSLNAATHLEARVIALPLGCGQPIAADRR